MGFLDFRSDLVCAQAGAGVVVISVIGLPPLLNLRVVAYLLTVPCNESGLFLTLSVRTILYLLGAPIMYLLYSVCVFRFVTY